MFRIARFALVLSLLVATVTGPTLLSAGAINGARYGVYNVTARNSNRHLPLTFIGGRVAEVIVEGDGDTELDLYIYDQNGNLVASDDDDSDYCVATWTPRWTGTFTIVVMNRGSVYNRYTLRTN